MGERLEFRDLRADEIEVKVSRGSDAGVDLLLYKDARCDMQILDETVGPLGWERGHELIGDTLYCTVSVYRPETGALVMKQDAGKPSEFEPEKGAASDSFKRACTNWGIGRELYTAPRIFVQKGLYHPYRNTTRDRFSVRKIIIRQHRILALAIRNDSMDGKTVFVWTAPGFKPEKKEG